MSVASVILPTLLAATLTAAAIRKLSHRPDVVESYSRVGVPEDRLDHLAIVLLAGAAGLIAGFFWRPVGVAAAAGVVCYFLLAIASHVRFGDSEHLATPIAIEAIAIGTLVLRIASP